MSSPTRMGEILREKQEAQEWAAGIAAKEASKPAGLFLGGATQGAAQLLSGSAEASVARGRHEEFGDSNSDLQMAIRDPLCGSLAEAIT